MAKRISKLIGKEVRITFLDHVEDGTKTMMCEVWGRVMGDDKNTLTIRSWDLPQEDEATRNANAKDWAIVKKCIQETKILR